VRTTMNMRTTKHVKSPARRKKHRKPPIPAIEMINLCKIFGKPGQRAVDDLSLTIQQGEIFGLLGPNGSGKTTTINMVSNALTCIDMQ
jgi:ABC-type uncharacterized transport system ATPase subunit